MLQDNLYYLIFAAHQILDLGYLEIYALTLDQIMELLMINEKGLEMIGEKSERTEPLTRSQADQIVRMFGDK